MFNGRRSSLDAAKLKQENGRLQLQLVRLGQELRNNRNYASGLELLLHERLERIDTSGHRRSTAAQEPALRPGKRPPRCDAGSEVGCCFNS
jgi:hypothetical protein